VRPDGWQRDRDRTHPNNGTPDTLTAGDLAAYRDGRWIGARVTSDELRGGSSRDPEGIAELAARCEVMSE
jgi:hypothetical protein